jgi:hypothetical protein
MAKKLSRTEKMRRLFAKNPEMTIAQVAAEFGVKYQTAYMAKRSMSKIKGWVSPDYIIPTGSVKDKVTSTTEEQNPNGMNAEERAEFMRQVAAQPRLSMQRAAPEGIDATLAERGTKYGKFADHAAVTYKLKNVLREHSGSHGKSYAYDQAEALDMICHKLGRIVNGDPDYADSWVDIAGYAKLVADRLQTGKTD